MKRCNPRRGIALIIVLQMLMVVLAIGLAFMVSSKDGLFFVGMERRGLQATYIAESALQRAMLELDQRSSFITTSARYSLIDSYHDKMRTDIVTDDTGQTVGSWRLITLVTPGPGQLPVVPAAVPWNERKNKVGGTFEAYKEVTFVVRGEARRDGEVVGVSRTVLGRVRVGMKRPDGDKYNDPFNYAYFSNSWGWWSGFAPEQVQMTGNTGANGNFDILSGSIRVDGNPFVSPDHKIVNPEAIYAAQQVRAADGSILGYGGLSSAQKNYAEKHVMPNLSEMSSYVEMARARNGTIAQNGNVLVNAAYGFDGGKQSLVLDGTKDPITINGPVVVAGNVVLKGTVKGEGTLYVGRNLYVAGDVTYADGPSKRPIYDPALQTPEEYADTLDGWREQNGDRDAVAYAVGHNVVFGDVTNKSDWWDNRVGKWLNYEEKVKAADGTIVREKINDNHEDTGTDQVWTSLDGTENDEKWTVRVATADGKTETVTLPVVNGKVTVPAGMSVVPGSGEDVDGDGAYTPPFDYHKDFAFADKDGTAIDFSSQFFGNFPDGASSYGSYEERTAKFDGFIYTNAAMAGTMGNGGELVIRGGEVSRQDAMMTWASKIKLEYDERFSSAANVPPQKVTRPLIPGTELMAWLDTQSVTFQEGSDLAKAAARLR